VAVVLLIELLPLIVMSVVLLFVLMGGFVVGCIEFFESGSQKWRWRR